MFQKTRDPLPNSVDQSECDNISMFYFKWLVTQKQKQTRGQNISGHGLARTETESKAGAKCLRKVSMTWSRVNVPPPNATKYLLRAKVLKASLFHGFYCLKYRIEMAVSGVRTRRIAHQALIVFEV